MQTSLAERRAAWSSHAEPAELRERGQDGPNERLAEVEGRVPEFNGQVLETGAVGVGSDRCGVGDRVDNWFIDGRGDILQGEACNGESERSSAAGVRRKARHSGDGCSDGGGTIGAVG